MRSEGKSTSRPTILCIDDDRFLLTLCCNLLESHGYRTILATDGPTGIETAQAGRPDLILLDLVMPGIDGLEVCRRLRSLPDFRETPIILFTARQDLRLDAEALEAGATLTLRKDFGFLEFLNTVARLLGRKSRPGGGPVRKRDRPPKSSGVKDARRTPGDPGAAAREEPDR
ncbi:MAG TPA: response regulator [Candidatus Sulfotelmatobacter sp.]|nr:response regulator [Candidatus Sulfotelmatobacter sp.]